MDLLCFYSKNASVSLRVLKLISIVPQFYSFDNCFLFLLVGGKVSFGTSRVFLVSISEALRSFFLACGLDVRFLVRIFMI